MPIQGVIFDLDGVIVDSGGLHYQSWRLLAEENHLNVTEDRFSQTFGRQNKDILPLIWGRPLPPERIESLGERKEALFRELAHDNLRPIEGSLELIVACGREGLLLAIGSSTHPANLDMVLSDLKLTEFFQATVTAKDAARGKPHPDVFLLAADRLGLPPDRCAVIEDAPSGVEAAAAAGCLAIGLTTHHARAVLVGKGANVVVDSLNELTPARIRSLG